jgi:hypothetical protein
MPCREYRAFLLNHSLHTSFVQVLADSIWVEGLIDDIGERFGHLDSILGPVSRDEGGWHGGHWQGKAWIDNLHWISAGQNAPWHEI